MAFKKRQGVLATPGEYTYGDVTETKTAEELQKAVERQPTIMLTMGHPNSGFPLASDFIGTVTQSWDGENKRVLGDFWFYEESESKIPQHIRRKIVNNEPVPISTGFAIDDVVDGVQKGLVYTHVAVLEDEEPVCPLDKCGVNVRQESSSMPDMRLEEKTELTEPDAETESEEEVSKSEGPTISELQSDIEKLKQTLSELQSDEEQTDEASAEQEPESSEESEDSQEQEEKEPEPEPKRVIPKGTPSKQRNWTREDGVITWESPSGEE